MTLIGVSNPESKVNGIITMDENSIACCIVETTDEINRPMPTTAKRNRLSPIERVAKEPAYGIRNYS
jgi:hypothetical protein